MIYTKKLTFIFVMGFLSISVLEAEPLAHPTKKTWGFTGLFGTFNKAALQRGFQVYKEVCSACHGLKRIRFRELSALGFTPAQIKALAATYTIKIINDVGEEAERPGLPSDAFPDHHPNEQAARAAHHGALPPDQSLIVKARPNGPDYIYAILTGYGQKPPKDMVIAEGRFYNPYMSGGQIAMDPPLQEGQVTYSDGTKATIDQMARDVVEFLAWAAEPEMEDRKRTGFAVLIYLLVMTGIFIAAKRRIWKDVH